MSSRIIEWGSVFFLLYFILLNLSYLFLNIIAAFSIKKYRHQRRIDPSITIFSGFELPVSIIVPSYNEEKTVCQTVFSLLQLTYSQFEIIVVNDGSSDRTLHELIKTFDLIAFPEDFPGNLVTQPLRSCYRSKKYPQIRVIDKSNGGKADALNAGLNLAKYPLFCSIDSDSILQRNSLQQASKPFLEDPHTVASGGTIRIINGCEVKDGYLIKNGLPKSFRVSIQIVEYLRAFLFGRMGWSPFNALLVISGAFGLFHRDTVLKYGGYRTDTVGEDMELVVRLHRSLRKDKLDYRIYYIPDPICWTEAPEDLKTLKKQRMRWQIGLSESLVKNRQLLFSRGGGWSGWAAFPFMVFFEWIGPLIECLGYLFFILSYLSGTISLESFLSFLLLAFGIGLLISTHAIFLEEISFHLYGRYQDIFRLFGAAILENFGYRQWNSFWRSIALFKWLFFKKHTWGKMERMAHWSTKHATSPQKNPLS